jgi:hypothetical protein
MKHISRLLLALSCAVLISATANAQFGVANTPLSALGSTTTGAYPATSGVPIAGATSVVFHVFSASTSTAAINFEQSVDGTHFYPLVTVTNPSSSGELWGCPAARLARFNVTSHAAGTVSGTMTWRNMVADPIGTGCHRLDNYGGFTFASGTGTFNVTSGKTAAVTGSLTFAGTDSTTMTFPTTSATVARSDAANTFTGTQSVTTIMAANKFKALTASPPTVTGGASTCGTTAAAIVGGDTGGTVTVGSVGGTVCVVTFGSTWTNVPACVVQRGVAAGSLVVATTATTLTATATFGAAETFSYVCIGY